MVIHEDGESATEVSVIRKPLFESQSYVIVKNHVRELTMKPENQAKSPIGEQNLSGKVDSNKKKKVNKNLKRRAQSNNTLLTSLAVNEDSTPNEATEVSQTDLQELRSVYDKCKAVLNKIEQKYGHLLNLAREDSSSKSPSNIQSSEEEFKCTCPQTSNKKIVFDDEGQQKTIETPIEDHICPKKPRRSYSEVASQNVKIEYTENEVNLSDNLQDLETILKNPNIDITYRNQVIDKVKNVRQENMHELKFNKLMLIEKLKSNPDEVFDFKGTNLSAMTGYPLYKSSQS